jgi:flagellar FliL protein
MSTAATATEAPVAAPAKGKKKLIIIIAAVLAVVLIGGGAGAYFMMKKSAAAAEAAAAAEGEDGAEVAADGHAPAKASSKKDGAHAPVFVPLEPFTVNLADREAERYAQIGVTLEIEDAKVADQIKAYMPAIRNNILMAIADRTAADLMGRDGKTKLAQRIMRETSRALGYAVEDEPTEEAAAAAEDEPAPAKKPAKKKKKSGAEPLPVKAVHFSNFIIQ